MKITLKPHASNDQKEVKDFILNSWKEFGFTYEKDLDYDLDDIQKYYIKDGGMFYVLKEQDKIVGSIGIINKGNGITELKRLYVAKEYRGKGLGSQLVDAAIKFCKDAGFKTIEFDTNKIFKIAHQLYLKKGFRIIKEDEDDLYMEKRCNNFNFLTYKEQFFPPVLQPALPQSNTILPYFHSTHS